MNTAGGRGERRRERSSGHIIDFCCAILYQFSTHQPAMQRTDRRRRGQFDRVSGERKRNPGRLVVCFQTTIFQKPKYKSIRKSWKCGSGDARRIEGNHFGMFTIFKKKKNNNKKWERMGIHGGIGKRAERPVTQSHRRAGFEQCVRWPVDGTEKRRKVHAAKGNRIREMHTIDVRWMIPLFLIQGEPFAYKQRFRTFVFDCFDIFSSFDLAVLIF